MKAKLLLLALSTLLALLMAELAVRGTLFFVDLAGAGKLGSEAVITDGRAVSLGDLIRPSENPRLIYELIPGLSVSFVGRPVSTNAAGFRGAAVTPDKAPGTVRILGLGDSIMFGWGVRHDETYMALLSGALQSRTNRRVESINTAVPGYNTAMEVETLREKGLAYEPDLVIINYIPNDMSLPNFISAGPAYASLRTSFLYTLVTDRLDELRPSRLVTAAPNAIGDGFEDDPTRVPAAYRDIVGPAAWRAAMVTLRSLADERDFDVVLLGGRMPELVTMACADLGIDVVDPNAEVWRFMQDNGIERYAGSVLTLSETDLHPSPIGHRLLFEALLRHLDESGWIPENLGG